MSVPVFFGSKEIILQFALSLAKLQNFDRAGFLNQTTTTELCTEWLGDSIYAVLFRYTCKYSLMWSQAREMHLFKPCGVV